MASIDVGTAGSNSQDYNRDLSRMSSTLSYLSSMTSTEDEEYEILPLPESELDQDFLDAGKLDESQEVLSKIPFKKIHDQAVPFDHPKRRCFLPGQKIHVEILGVDDSEIGSMFNPNLYLILIRHADFQWKIRRRYKHFRHIHEHLMLHRAMFKMPMPSKEHRQRRKDFRERRNTLPRFPKKPEPLVRGDGMEKRQKQLEVYLQNILKCSQYRNHPEVLKFLEVSHLSFIFGLGAKYREGMVRKKAGGRKIGMSCCVCLGGPCVGPVAAWNNSTTLMNKGVGAATPYNALEQRWLIVKDTFVAYINPQTGTVNDLLLMDREFEVECGLLSTGVRHGLVISNLSRHLTLKCWTQRKAREWHSEIERVMHTTGRDFIEKQRFDSFAPLRENSFANWFVDGASYMEAVADAVEGAKEEIFITDWWLTPEIYMKRPITEGEKWRLDFLLKRKACQGIKIFIMVYKEMEVALGINSYYSKTKLQNLHPTNVKVLRHPDGISIWSHHEKCVIIDQRIAFLGGIDLCYGRWDTRAHRLTDLGDLAIVENMRTASGKLQDFAISADDEINFSQTSEGIRARRARFSTIQERSEEEELGKQAASSQAEADHGVFTYPDIHSRLDTLDESRQITLDNTVTSTSSDPIIVEDATHSSDLPGAIHITSIQLDSLPSTPDRGVQAQRVDSLREHDTEESCLDTDDEYLNQANTDSLDNVHVTIIDKHSTQHMVSIQSDINGSYLNSANSDSESADVSQINTVTHSAGFTTWASTIPTKPSHTPPNSVEEITDNGAVDINKNNNANKSDPAQSSTSNNNEQESTGESRRGLAVSSDLPSQSSCRDSVATSKTTTASQSSVVTSSVKSLNKESPCESSEEKADHVLAETLPKQNGDISNSTACDSSVDSPSDSAINNNQVPSRDAKNDIGQNEEMTTKRLWGDLSRFNPGGVQRANSAERQSMPGSVLMENSPTKTVLNINRSRPKSLADVARLLIDRNKEPDEPAPFKNYLRTIALQVMEQQRESRSNGSSGSLNSTPDDNKDPQKQDGSHDVEMDRSKEEPRKRRPPKLHLNMPHMTGRRRGSKGSEMSEEGLEVEPGGEISGPLADAVRAAASGLPTKPTTPRSKRRGIMAQKAKDFRSDIKDKFRKNKSMSVDITEDAKTLDSRSSMDIYIKKGEQKVIDPLATLADLGLEGSIKTWIGKDYANFIIKDLSNVDHPFTDLVDRRETPRMPWHDIGSVVYGKSARDVARHFIQRWNFTKLQKHKKHPDYPLLIPKDYSHISVPMWVIQSAFCANCQVLRSAARWSAGITETEMSIQTAYLHLIDSAKHYIYIENQFFISIAKHASVKNNIADALYNRIIRAYQEGETFRVYVILPLLPAFEGQLGTASGLSIQAVTHWNYLSLSRGGRSLLERLVKEGRVPDPFEYISFYGLRKHEECLGNLMTELVYVHCKLMIVDDTKVIIGSANINDRSMVGNRDSELAILVEDTQTTASVMDGQPYQAGHFALSLRKTLMKEHLGLTEDDLHIDVSDPIDSAFYKGTWLNQASINTTTYNKVFNCIPTDEVTKFSELREFQKRPVMAKTDLEKAKELLKQVRGQLVLMPLQFLVKERLAPAVHTKEGLAGVASIWT